MKPKILRIVPVTIMPIGNFRSIPAQIGVTSPAVPPPRPQHAVHPQEISGTAGPSFRALEPVNGSSLALECPPESRSGPAEE